MLLYNKSAEENNIHVFNTVAQMKEKGPAQWALGMQRLKECRGDVPCMGIGSWKTYYGRMQQN
jgi:hypothetical protein